MPARNTRILRVVSGLCALLPLALSAGIASASEEIAYGQYLSSECTACHQISGRQEGGIPAIVGWPEDQFVAVMDSYRQKHRENEVMQTIAGRLTKEELAALAAYFGSIKATH